MRVLHGLRDLCEFILQGKILDDLLLNTVKREKEEGWRCKRGHASNPRQHGRQLSRNFEAKVKPCSDANAGEGLEQDSDLRLGVKMERQMCVKEGC